jgi:hypothetical protein
MFTAIRIELPSIWIGPRPSKQDDSSHSTRLYQEYVPPEAVRNDPKIASAYKFHGEAAVE